MVVRWLEAGGWREVAEVGGWRRVAGSWWLEEPPPPATCRQPPTPASAPEKNLRPFVAFGR